MGSLGLDFESLRSVNENLIMLSSSMAGQAGPFARFAGYAPMFVALSGLGDMTGYPDGPPSQIRVGGDIIVGVHGGFALLAAIFGHLATGRGTHIDLSAIESQANLIGDAFLAYSAGGRVPTRRGNEEPGSSPHNTYRCRGEDQWVSIALGNDEEWDALVEALGGPAWAREDRFASVAGRDEHRGALDRLLGEWTIGRSPIEVTSLLQGAGVAAMPSYRAPELFTDPHVVARNLVVEVPGEGGDHPLIRLGGILPASPLRLDRAGPAMGEHNHEVFTTLLGLSEEEIAALGEDEVFA
jgi:benzylsuccinate CoA-transferase BbsF subunit